MTTRSRRARVAPVSAAPVSATPPTVSLAGSQTLREAAETRALLLRALQEQPHVTVDCAAVTSVDASFVQLLLAAGRTAESGGKRFALRSPPEGALLDALHRSGVLRDDAGRPGAEPAHWMGTGDPT